MTAATATGAATLTVAEVYPATPATPCWQGEGPSAGRRCAFIRLGGCNLSCGWQRTNRGLERVPGAWACDEPKTWHSGHNLRTTLHEIPAAQITDRILALGPPPLVIITGGEPLLHQDREGFRLLADTLLAAGADIEVETNGTLVPSWSHKRIAYNVSPKLTSSGLPHEDRIVPAALAWHAACPRSVFKLVCASPADVDEAAALAAETGVPPGRVWIMPEGTTPGRVLDAARAIAPQAGRHGFNLTLRQHVLLYGEQGEPRD